MIIPRQALQLKTEQQGQEKTQQSPPTPVDLSSLRDQHAWVLLGEPGAGKTTAFKEEAKACGGKFISVADFIHPENSLDDWQDSTLFLDGLDETTDDIQKTLISIRNQLKKLSQPKFRLACRAADWQGAFFLEKLQGATSAQTEIAVYTLQPLSEEDIQTRVEVYFQQQGRPEQAQTFLELTKQYQASDWLGNPQTLEWMLKLPENEWPQSKQDLFEKTCERLTQEHNRTHRGKQGQNPAPSTNDTLAAAGELFALLLLSNKQGIAMDRGSKTALYPELNDFSPSNTSTCAHALKTQLFKPAHSAQERVEPIHRSVAEYLAAKYLEKQLKQLPLSRLLNVLTGHDRKCIDGLRNLYAWLVNFSTNTSEILLKQDPLSVALYGNAENWTKQQTEAFLDALKEAISKDSHLLLRSRDDNLKNLYRPELIPNYLEWLQSHERTETHQAWLHAILQMLERDPTNNTELNSALLDIIKDSSHNYYSLRSQAMNVWLRSNPSKSDIQNLLDAIRNQTIADNNRDLAGALLRKAYPSLLSTKEVLQYFEKLDPAEGEPRIYGLHHLFWLDEFPTLVPANELQQTLNTLAQHPLVKSISYQQYNLCELLSKLIARAITELGEQASDAQLLDWLMIGIDQHGTHHLKDVVRHKEYNPITDWFNTHPERYQGVLGVAYQRSEQHSDPTRQLFVYKKALAGFTPPPNMATWHFEQVDQTTHPDLKKEHLGQAVSSLWQGNSGTLTLEHVGNWAAQNASKQAMLAPCLQCEINEWRYGYWRQDRNIKQEHDAEKQKRSEELKTLLPSIEQGSAPAGIMGFAAKHWKGETIYHGKTPEERLANYCYQADALKLAIEQGMPRCLTRNDLPTCEDIIQLHTQNEYHHIQPACLLGAEFIWSKDPTHLLNLPENTLKTLVCFQLTSHSSLKETVWFLRLAQAKPTLIAEVFIALGKACFKAKLDNMPNLDELTHTNPDEYPELHSIAQQVVLPLLEAFPLKATETQIKQLRILLTLANSTDPSQFNTLITKKLAKKSLDPAQKTYWLLTGFNHNPTLYENAILKHLDESNQALPHLHKFSFNWDHTPRVDSQAWSTHFLGQLIERSAPLVPEERLRRGVRIMPTLDWHRFTHTLIQELTQRATSENIAELERLQALPSTSTLHYTLRESLHSAQERQREQAFKFLEPRDLSKILNNKTPVNTADLHALTLAYLDDVADHIRKSNSDIFRQFWNENNNKPTSHKNENSCRDALLELLKAKLTPLDVRCDPEADYVNDKRADIRLSVGPNISIPIEIKGEWHKDLWDAIQNQLIPQYTREKSSEGFGIYVVLWTDGTEQPNPKDGGKKPKTPEKLEERLRQHSIPIEKKSLIEVRVLDVSWPS